MIFSQYFEMRFGRGIRSFGSALFIVGMVLWLPIAIYVPAITFNQVSGIGIHVITPIVCVICTFYTCVGGLKAVIWTDVIQSAVMYGSVLAVCIKGTIDVGGFGVVWQRNSDGGRLNAPAYTWDPTVRLSMASVLIGGTLHKIQSSAVNQISIQRYLSLPNYKQARKAMLLFTILLTFLLLCCAYVGLVSFATFFDCDPLTTKLARASDQLPSLLMMRTLGDYPGLPGLFVAGVFSAALSSLSTGLNSLACVISQDLINPFVKRKLSEKNTAILLRFIVIFFGLGCIGLVFIVEKMGMVLELSSMTGAVTMGPLLGVYAMGVCLPWINGKYFERRFDRRIRVFGSLLFVASAILWMPIGIYMPALTFNQVSGISVHVIVPVVCVICTIYTTIGGIKGVVWTDVIQGMIMIGSMLLIIIKGTIDVGGLGIVWERNMASGRLVAPELTFDPTARMGILAVLIGGAAFKLQANCINQAIVQRFLTLPDMKSVKKSLIWSLIGFLCVMAMCIYIGLLAFAEYYDCDPITTKLAQKKDQVIPLYVMQSASIYPGVVGLFVAGVFSAALSSLSTLLNSLSAVILKDFVEVFRSEPLTERQTAYVMRGVVIFFGLISMLGVHVVKELGMVMQLSASVASITCGPLLGAFSVGMLLPFVNTKSLLAGISVASSFIIYIVVRGQIAMATGDMIIPTKPVSVEGCTYDFELPANTTVHKAATTKSLHDISFLWYTFIGSAGTILCSLLATLYFGKQNPLDVPPELLAQCVRSYWHPNYSQVAAEEPKEKFKLELLPPRSKVNDNNSNQANGDR